MHGAAFGGLRRWMAKWMKRRLNVEEFYEVMMAKREQQMFEVYCLPWGNGHTGHALGRTEDVICYVHRRRMRLYLFACLLACLFLAILRYR